MSCRTCGEHSIICAFCGQCLQHCKCNFGEQIQSLQRRLASTENLLDEKQAECERWATRFAKLSNDYDRLADDSAIVDVRQALANASMKITRLESEVALPETWGYGSLDEMREELEEINSLLNQEAGEESYEGEDSLTERVRHRMFRLKNLEQKQAECERWANRYAAQTTELAIVKHNYDTLLQDAVEMREARIVSENAWKAAFDVWAQENQDLRFSRDHIEKQLNKEIERLKEEIEKKDKILQIAGLALAFKETKETQPPD